ncbi:amidase domain-containing protein [Metabacillus arenae]|uniref:Amidase domain-containing protein n=1 Tax=Metabacillus arenae TaxID=2771434 RepID=A0A926NLU4_9BACI|nr:amidase domain-containing protein [Metabacillus arenae]MBD1382328.1 amidase domain-containing protein [Metabacillus arenae]
MKQAIAELLESRLERLINRRESESLRMIDDMQKVENKYELLKRRNVDLMKGKVRVSIQKVADSSRTEKEIEYKAHYQFLYNDHAKLYIEETVENRKALFYLEEIISDRELPFPFQEASAELEAEEEDFPRTNFHYDRLAAVQYAERWWDSENPAYKNFDVNCTNFISQCLHAGGAKMRGYPNRSSGWWMQNNNWSYSWTVANSMRMFLPQSKTGLRGREVSTAQQLMPGDVIAYDFQGDGRYDHTTFVVAKDKSQMPLVNAQTYNSRMRYWSYEDSTAYTPNIKYKFFHIIDDSSKK